MRLLMIDNYDSFTYNLVQLFYEFDLDVVVFRHDQTSLEDIASLAPHYICISPGPKDPAHAGISKAVVERFAGEIPIIGVCLGMQVIAEVFNGRVRKAPLPVHGKRCRAEHRGEGIFSGLPSPLWVARYHSLQVELGSRMLNVTACADDGVIMGIQHRTLPLCGVQFHPESFMTEFGYELVANFLALRSRWRPVPLSPIPEDRFPRLAYDSSPTSRRTGTVRETRMS